MIAITPNTTKTAARPSGFTKRRALVATLAGSALVLTGCANAGEGALSGAGLGALAGLVVGSMTGNAGDGAAIGAAIGGVGGAVIGDSNERADRRARTPRRVEYHEHYDRRRYSDDW